MEELSTFKAAFGYCLQIVFQREYQYVYMTDENMFSAALWIVTFVLMLVLVLVNLMLAMIFDNYGTVRDQVAKNETIMVFTRRLLTQLRLQSSWISNTDLLTKLVQIAPTDSPSMQSVRRQFPEISQQQLELIFSHASQKQTQMMTSACKNSLSEYVAGLLLYLRDVRDGVRMMSGNGQKEQPDTSATMVNGNGANGSSFSSRLGSLNTDLLTKFVQIPATDSPSMQAVRRQFPEISQQQLDLVFSHASQKQTLMMTFACKNSLSEYVAGLLLYLREVRDGVRMMSSNGQKEQPDTSATMANGNSTNMDGPPPMQKPEWVRTGLIGALRKQQDVMQDVLEQMEQMNKKMGSRGLQGSVGFTLEKPPRPDVEKWGGDASRGLLEGAKGRLKSAKGRLKDAKRRFEACSIERRSSFGVPRARLAAPQVAA
eukprot:CAMPEP_0115461672 /NCGR_PEP_ID=MMETSP0271-20121206/47425_1 /TAXON_ID=71861 /ORGANISM="Scrippsiella trochoidea, Strain CCMP3099" /LENGTH=427 /DNA_ID=CAMNT_0002888427 /DNA_START=125 /DNA_END=1408 /DNA_ORIENTATION=+